MSESSELIGCHSVETETDTETHPPDNAVTTTHPPSKQPSSPSSPCTRTIQPPIGKDGGCQLAPSNGHLWDAQGHVENCFGLQTSLLKHTSVSQQHYVWQPHQLQGPGLDTLWSGLGCPPVALRSIQVMDDPSIVVLDYGSRNFRGGFAYNFPSDDEPRVIMPTAVHVQQQPAQTTPEQPSGQQSDGGMATHQPVVKGQVRSMQQLEALIHHCLYRQLGWVYGSEGCAVLCEPLLTPRADRELLTQLMFETFNVSGLFCQDHAVLSLYGIGKVSGSVVDMGYGKLDVATVADGQLSSASVRRLPMGGEELNGAMAEAMRRRGTELGGAAQAEALKEACMQAADSAPEYDRMAASAAAGPSGSSSSTGGDPQPPDPKVYRLPDGQEVTVGIEGLQLAEGLFRPDLLGGSGPGLAETLLDSVQTQYEGNFRRPGLENILVCGGGSGAANVPQRLLRDVRALAHPSLQPALCAIPEYMPKHACKHAAWIGGAVLGKVVHGQNQFMSKWDYEEAGPNAVHRRCI